MEAERPNVFLEVLPNFQNAVVPTNKLKNYILNIAHTFGSYKAQAFESKLGFNKWDFQELVKTIVEQLPSKEAFRVNSDKHGERFYVDLPITGHNGKTALVRTYWLIKTGTDVPILDTASVL